MLFSLVLALCQRFTALSPFSVYRERFCDVMILFVDLKQNLARSGTKQAKTMIIGGEVYTEALNDDWY